MESKTQNECSDLIRGGGKSLLVRGKPCDGWKNTASGTSNLFTASSSHDSVSGSAESIKTMKIHDTLEDIGLAPKLSLGEGGRLGEDQFNVGAQGGGHVFSPGCPPSVVDQRTFSRIYEHKDLDSDYDDISCLSGVNSANTGRKNACVVTSSAPYLSPKSDIPVLPYSKDIYGVGDFQELPENSTYLVHGEPSESVLEHAESSLAESAITTRADGHKPAVPNVEDTEFQLASDDSSASLMKIQLTLESKSDMDTEILSSKSSKSTDLDKQAGGTTALLDASNMEEPPLQPQLVSESRDSGSDIVEDDVKVCDICGDTGHEDMLAICSKCSDGAEHTYCMRVMLDKVPEGGWLCEGCKFMMDAENEKHEQTLPKSQNQGPTVSPKLFPKLDNNSEKSEGNCGKEIITSPWVASQMQSDNEEVSSMQKKQATGMIVRSPGKRTPSLNSFKHLDVGKLKSAHSHPVNDSVQEASVYLASSSPNSSRMQARPLSIQSPSSRSKNFSSSNLKPKVKLILEDVTQRQKLATEFDAGYTKKEGLVQTFSKSMSFKTQSLSFSKANEAKVQMLSPNLSCSHDPKGMKFYKEKHLLERSSFKCDRPTVISSPATPTAMSVPKADLANREFEAALVSACHKDHLSSSKSFPSLQLACPGVDHIPSISGETNLKACMIKMATQASVLGHPLRNSVIPDHDYIWQGGFEVQRSGGRFLEFFNGMQAHLSTSASPKVPEQVNKFSYKVQLEEVPRPSTWPMQFQGKGPCEDNIAIYFFAKDSQSYERNYKKLVECMIKNDLALKGNINEVELLIFPSNQLPEKAKSWNRLSYLWAVFRERKEKGSEYHPGSRKNLSVDSLGVELKVKNGPLPVTSEKKFYRDSGIGHCIEHHPSVLTTNQQNGLEEIKEVPVSSDAATCVKPGFTSSLGTRQVLTSISSEIIPELYSAAPESNRERERNREGEKEKLMGNGIFLERCLSRDPIKIDYGRSELRSSGKRPHPDTSEAAIEDYGGISRAKQATSGQENTECTLVGGNELKKTKCNSESSFSVGPEEDRFSSKMLDSNSSFLELEKNGNLIFENGLFSRHSSTIEKPLSVNIGSVKSCNSSGNSVPWIEISSDEEDMPESGLPDLELALGAEKKSPNTEALPLLLQLIDEKKNQNGVPGPVTDDVTSASLSLSLLLSHSPKRNKLKNLFQNSKTVLT